MGCREWSEPSFHGGVRADTMQCDGLQEPELADEAAQFCLGECPAMTDFEQPAPASQASQEDLTAVLGCCVARAVNKVLAQVVRRARRNPVAPAGQ